MRLLCCISVDNQIPSCHLGCGPRSPRVWVTLASCQSSIDEDVPGPASAPLLDLRPDLSYHAGTQAGLQDQLELVSYLPPCLDL